MGTKQEIIGSLGEKQLLLPGLVQSGLAANDRVKYYFTLLQLAREQCEQPAPNPPDLQREREASGVADTEFDGVIAASRGLPGGRCRIPGAAALLGRVLDCLKGMLAPVELAQELGLESGADEYRKRLAAVTKLARGVRRDLVPAGLIAALTSGERKRGDTAHLLVMDLHKALNRLQGELSRESVDGARVYGLRAQDKELVRAFMRGLNSTQALKLDHPGLGTTATAERQAAGAAERHRHDRCACAGGARRRTGGHRHLFRRAPGAAAVLPEPVRKVRGAMGGNPLAPRKRAERGRHLSFVHRRATRRATASSWRSTWPSSVRAWCS